MDLRRPPNAVRLLVKHYRGSTITTRFQLNGYNSYSIDVLENHRNEVLSQDPWIVVRSAFYGDTSIWPPILPADVQTIAMYVDALAILTHYYPEKLKTAFYEKVPELVRDGIPRAEFTMLLGMASGPEAFNVFSSCIRHNNGQLMPTAAALELSLDNLL